jgi:hypothetical protein
MFPYLVHALFSIPEIAKVMTLTQPAITREATRALLPSLISESKLGYLTGIWPANGPLNTQAAISSYIQKIEAFFADITGEGQKEMRLQLYDHLLKDISKGPDQRQQFIGAFARFVRTFTSRLQNIPLNLDQLADFVELDQNIYDLYDNCQLKRQK